MTWQTVITLEQNDPRSIRSDQLLSKRTDKTHPEGSPIHPQDKCANLNTTHFPAPMGYDLKERMSFQRDKVVPRSGLCFPSFLSAFLPVEKWEKAKHIHTIPSRSYCNHRGTQGRLPVSSSGQARSMFVNNFIKSKLYSKEHRKSASSGSVNASRRVPSLG